MAKNCIYYYKNGMEAAMLSGYTPQNIATCDIKRIHKTARSSGLSHGGKATRRSKRINKTRKRRL